MRSAKRAWLAAICLSVTASACVELDVRNPNAPNRTQVLATATDVESLVSTTYNTWFKGVYSYYGSTLLLSVAAFQHTSPSSCAGLEYFGRLPREPIPNESGDVFYGNWTRPWFQSYRAIAAAADALRALENPRIATELGADNLARDKAFANLVLGLGHATVALLYDQGFVVGEATDISQPQPPRPYQDVMKGAMPFFDEALSLAAGASFSIPRAWIATDEDLPAADFVRLVHSLKARYLVEVARTPAERAAVDWTRVVAEIEAGMTSPFIQDMDWQSPWYNESLEYLTQQCGGATPYFVWGMADQSGNYQLWLNTPLAERSPVIDGRNILIVTPDRRFPQGSTREEQTTRRGTYVVIPTLEDYDDVPEDNWYRPDRGRWRWTFYSYMRYWRYHSWVAGYSHVPEILLSEMDMLKAEGLYRTGDRAGAAALVNKTRVSIGGLSPTDAAGTNTSCVPRLPDGRCGDLFEMIKWEKRVEGAFVGLGGVPWYYDARGWGDLYKGTPLQFPVPCGELQLMKIDCYTFGGPTKPSSAPVSSYAYPGES